MVDCDMCGKKDIQVKRVKVEGTEMSVCVNCARFGTELVDHSKRQNNFSKQKFERNNPDENKTLVDNFGAIIKAGRESKNMKQSELAKIVSEKESLLHSIESGHTRPNFKVARKLQKFLHIKLIEDIENKRGSLDDITPRETAKPLTMEEKVLAALKKEKK